jgi:hypothetical protein
LAFACAASVVDVGNISCAYSPIEEFHFVYLSDKVGACGRVVLANEECLGVR